MMSLHTGGASRRTRRAMSFGLIAVLFSLVLGVGAVGSAAAAPTSTTSSSSVKAMTTGNPVAACEFQRTWTSACLPQRWTYSNEAGCALDMKYSPSGWAVDQFCIRYLGKVTKVYQPTCAGASVPMVQVVTKARATIGYTASATAPKYRVFSGVTAGTRTFKLPALKLGTTARWYVWMTFSGHPGVYYYGRYTVARPSLKACIATVTVRQPTCTSGTPVMSVTLRADASIGWTTWPSTRVRPAWKYFEAARGHTYTFALPYMRLGQVVDRWGVVSVTDPSVGVLYYYQRVARPSAATCS